MAWHFHLPFRNRPAGPAAAGATTAPTAQRAPADGPARGNGAWATLPPLRAGVQRAPVTAPTTDFVNDVRAGVTAPLSLAPLGHERSADGPAGLVSATSRPIAASRPTVARVAANAPGGDSHRTFRNPFRRPPAVQRADATAPAGGPEEDDEQAVAPVAREVAASTGSSSAFTGSTAGGAARPSAAGGSPGGMASYAAPARRLAAVEAPRADGPSLIRASDVAPRVDGMMRSATEAGTPVSRSTETFGSALSGPAALAAAVLPPMSGSGGMPFDAPAHVPTQRSSIATPAVDARPARLSVGQARRLGLGAPISSSHTDAAPTVSRAPDAASSAASPLPLPQIPAVGESTTPTAQRSVASAPDDAARAADAGGQPVVSRSASQQAGQTAGAAAPTRPASEAPLVSRTALASMPTSSAMNDASAVQRSAGPAAMLPSIQGGRRGPASTGAAAATGVPSSVQRAKHGSGGAQAMAAVLGGLDGTEAPDLEPEPGARSNPVQRSVETSRAGTEPAVEEVVGLASANPLRGAASLQREGDDAAEEDETGGPPTAARSVQRQPALATRTAASASNAVGMSAATVARSVDALDGPATAAEPVPTVARRLAATSATSVTATAPVVRAVPLQREVRPIVSRRPSLLAAPDEGDTGGATTATGTSSQPGWARNTNGNAGSASSAPFTPSVGSAVSGSASSATATAPAHLHASSAGSAAVQRRSVASDPVPGAPVQRLASVPAGSTPVTSGITHRPSPPLVLRSAAHDHGADEQGPEDVQRRLAAADSPMPIAQRSAATHDAPAGPVVARQMAAPGSVAIDLPAVQRAPDAAGPAAAPATPAQADGSAGGAPAGIPTGDKELDDLAHRLYDRLRTRLRLELLIDRERSGTLSDFG